MLILLECSVVVLVLFVVFLSYLFSCEDMIGMSKSLFIVSLSLLYQASLNSRTCLVCARPSTLVSVQSNVWCTKCIYDVPYRLSPQCNGDSGTRDTGRTVKHCIDCIVESQECSNL